MSHEDLDLITKERDGYRAILEFIVSGDCPDPEKTTDCLINGMRCDHCLMGHARAEMEKLNGQAT